MFSLIAIPIGVTLGAVAWALARGKGGLRGLIGHLALTIAGSVVGGFGAAAVFGLDAQPAIGIGALIGGLLFMAVVAFAFRRPRSMPPESPSTSG